MIKNLGKDNTFLERMAWSLSIIAVPALASRFCVFKKTQRAPTKARSGLFERGDCFICQQLRIRCGFMK
jgi:hypothetical protein